jgi:hypothetical protein
MGIPNRLSLRSKRSRRRYAATFAFLPAGGKRS